MTNDAIEATKYWLAEVVIGLNFCPFAREVVDSGAIRFLNCTAQTHQDIVDELMKEIDFLEENESLATSLVILSHACNDFYEFLDVVDTCNEELMAAGCEGVYQLAHFHPDYCFAGEDPEDASHFTNRSPYPVLHILREAVIDDALEHYVNPEAIPERNVEVARKQGADYFHTIMANARK